MRDKSLLEESIAILRQSTVLKDTVEFLGKEVDEVCGKYSDEEVDELGWEEREAHVKKIDELCGRLHESVRELEKLDVKYQELRERVRKVYGKDVLPPLAKTTLFQIKPDDEIDLRG